MKHSIVLSAALSAVAGLVTPAYAETVTDNAVIVTATRTAQTVDDTLAAVTVIDRDQIKRSQAKTVAELVTGTPGVDSTVSGGLGKNTSFFLRGTKSEHVLVMIDGIRVGSATLGSTAWQFLPLSQIDRIEIVRGPRSSLYGSEAIGGVIQIFTRKGNKKAEKSITVTAGTYDTYETAFSMAGASENTGYHISASHFITEGFDAREPISGFFPLDEPDNDGYRNDSVTANVSHRMDSGTEIGATLFHAEGDTEFDGNFQNTTDFIQQAFGARLMTSPADMWTAKLQAGRSRDDQDNFLDGVFTSNFDTTRDTASWQNDLTLSAQQLLTLGIDYQKDKVSSNINYTVNARDNTGYFAQYQETTGKHRFMLGIRQDDNQQFDKYTTGDAAWGYSINENLSYTLSYGTAFKAPTFNELYFPNFGNPNLQPEESQSVETAIKGRQSWGKWDIRAYQTSIDDLIATVCNPITFLCNAANVNKARIHGMEATVIATVSGWTTSFYLTLLDPRDKESDKVLPRRAKQTLKFSADRSIGKWQIGASLLAQSHRFDDVDNDIRVGGYGLVNLRAQYEPARHWFLRATLDNLFNKAYQTVKTYNSAGRAIFLSVGYRAQGS